MKQSKTFDLVDNLDPVPLYKLILLSFYGVCKEFFVKKTVSKSYPKMINNFSFISEVKSSLLQPDISSTLYKNEIGQKIVVKFWHGKIKNYHYYSFLNELKAYLVLNTMIKKYRKFMPRKLKNVSVPKIIFAKKTKNSIYFAREYKQGKVAFLLNPKTKLKVYFQAIDFLTSLSKKMSNEEKALLIKRQPISYIVSYPCILILAIIAQPNMLPLFIKSIVPFSQAMFSLTKNFQGTLTHRDLHFKNILVSKNSVYLIDLQYLAITEQLQEFATTLRYRWAVDEFQNLFIKELVSRYGKQQSFKVLFKGFIINSLVHGFTNKQFPKEKIEHWKNLLRWALNKDYINYI